jgi:hypothetical protein
MRTLLRLSPLLCATTLFISHAEAQQGLKKSETRTIDGGGSAGVGLTPAPPKTPEKIIKNVTYMALSDKRAWKSADGKTIIAMLLAFDTEGKSAEELKASPVTVIKKGQVRLLKDSKEFILPMKRLSEPDQNFVRDVLEKFHGQEIPEEQPKTADAVE